MKKILSIALIVVSIFAFVGCSPKEPAASVAVSDIMGSIKEQVVTDLKANGVPDDQFTDGKVPGYMVTDIINTEEEHPTAKLFNKEDMEEGMILQHMMNLNSDLIIVVKAKEDAKVETIKEVLGSIKEQQVKTWETYLPDQYKKVQDNIIEVKDNYLIYSTYSDSEKIKEIFEQAFNTEE